jgi:two-component system, LytTR family, sensor kinase
VADLVNVVLVVVALSLYGMLLWTVLQGGERPWRERLLGGGDGLVFSTALLGLAWNAEALSLLWPGARAPVTFLGELRAAVAYSALGFLPAVFVDAALRPWGDRRPVGSWLPFAGYGLSALAAALLLYAAAASRPAATAVALRLLAAGFFALIPVLLWIAPRGARVRRGLVSALALLAFAACAAHLSSHTAGSDSVASAFFGHHASLPLILAILYEDYRFALVDIFLKRALALLLLAASVLGLYAAVAGPLFSGDGSVPDARAVGALLGLWAMTAVAFPELRRAVDRFVDRVLLRRPDYARLRGELQDLVLRLEDAEAILDAVCERLRSALSASLVTWSEVGDAQAAPVTSARPGGASTVPVHTTDPPRFALHVGGLPAGRRLLSDDVGLLEAVALLAARRLDSLRLTAERWQRDVREQEILRLAAEAELRALQAQLNPHFLFNALNTLGYLMRAAPERAHATLLDLTQLLRAVLKRTTGELVTLGQEMELIESYLAIEQARFEDRLRVRIDVPEELRRTTLPPLLVQPLVENAIKHGIAASAEGGEVAISARVEPGDPGSLVVEVSDCVRAADAQRLAPGGRRGVGLSNIEKRLASYYGARASVELSRRPGLGARATLRIPLGLSDAQHAPAAARGAVRS